jgi:hypothetical protein
VRVEVHATREGSLEIVKWLDERGDYTTRFIVEPHLLDQFSYEVITAIVQARQRLLKEGVERGGG